MKRHLLTKIQNRTATIAVIGLAPFGLAQDMLRPGPLRLSSGHASTGPLRLSSGHASTGSGHCSGQRPLRLSSGHASTDPFRLSSGHASTGSGHCSGQRPLRLSSGHASTGSGHCSGQRPLRLSSGHASTGPSITPLDVLGRGPFDKLRTQLRASPAQDAVVDALNEAGKPLKGSNVLVLKDASQCWA